MKSITEIVLPERGMKVLAFSTIPTKPATAIVLVEDADESEWVTWTIFANDEVPTRWDLCEWGHYFDNVEDAWNDYVDRTINPRIVPLRRVKP
jgi:hypothetical protein